MASKGESDSNLSSNFNQPVLGNQQSHNIDPIQFSSERNKEDQPEALDTDPIINRGDQTNIDFHGHPLQTSANVGEPVDHRPELIPPGRRAIISAESQDI